MDVYLYTCTWCTHLVPFFEGYLRLAMFPSNFVNYTPRLLVLQSPCPCPCRCSLPWTASSWAPVVGSPSRKARPSGSARGWVCSSQLRCGRSYFPKLDVLNRTENIYLVYMDVPYFPENWWNMIKIAWIWCSSAKMEGFCWLWANPQLPNDSSCRGSPWTTKPSNWNYATRCMALPRSSGGCQQESVALLKQFDNRS